MTQDEVRVLIAKSERYLKSKNIAHPLGSWLGTLASTPLFLMVSDSVSATIWGLGFGLLSSSVSLFYSQAARNLRQGKALVIWNYLSRSGKLGSSVSQATQVSINMVRRVYQRDPQGQFFPLNQAIRLINTHHRQQQRLSQLKRRIDELAYLREQFTQKVAQLAQLGEPHPNSQETLFQFDRDIGTLNRMRDQVEASCQRLELLLISVDKSSQIKQLNQELSGITARAASTPQLPTHGQDDSLADIERQIGREIETFLQLERETDKHLQ